MTDDRAPLKCAGASSTPPANSIEREPAQAPVALGLIGPPVVSCTPPTASVSGEL